MKSKGKSEHIIEKEVGCGRFQVILYISVHLICAPGFVFTIFFMGFGNYNPGWKCLDATNINGTTIIPYHNVSVDALGVKAFSSANGLNQTASGLIGKEEDTDDFKAYCEAFDSCKTVQFDQETSTVVSEWGLICRKAWVSSLVISLQMAGLGIGGTIAGFIGDLFGRRNMLIVAQMFTAVFNGVAAFSTSWQMFAAMRFLLGVSISFTICSGIVYVSEFMNTKWRGLFFSIPSFPFTVVCFAVVCLILKDWYLIHITTAIMCALGVLPLFWLPESLRWLEIKNKTKQFETTVHKIAKLNGKTLAPLNEMFGAMKLDTIGSDNNETVEKRTNIFRDTLHLFGKDFRIKTLIVFLHWTSVSLIYYALGFGVKALSGSIYINLIIFFGAECIVDASTMNIPNLIGRRKAGFLYSGTCGLCLLTAACLDRLSSGQIKSIGITAFVATGRIAISAFWVVLEVFIVEIYPTVLRGVATGYGLTAARMGGILAPILIPKDPSTFFLCYTAMGILGVICAVTTLALPETKGKALKDTFEDDVTDLPAPI